MQAQIENIVIFIAFSLAVAYLVKLFFFKKKTDTACSSCASGGACKAVSQDFQSNIN